MDDVKKDRYLFLDIDGVLNSYFGEQTDKMFTKSLMPQKDFFSSQNMMVLKFIVENIKDLKIIISSSWNIGHYWRLEEIFNFFEIPLYWDSIKYLKYEKFNKAELIIKYCEINNINTEDIVIIDDESFDLFFGKLYESTGNMNELLNKWIEYGKRTIKVNPHDGLIYADYEKMAKLFNLEPVIKIM